jgi:anti-sigma regulatory factor (Ser/Thr protein kinase)
MGTVPLDGDRRFANQSANGQVDGHTVIDLSLTVAVEPAAPSTLRRELRAVDQLADGMRPDLELLVTELASNVVRHSGLGHAATMEMRLHIQPGHVRVEMRDQGRGFQAPHGTTRSSDEASGYGLVLVDRIATRWGIGDGPGGYVWFELDERGV